MNVPQPSNSTTVVDEHTSPSPMQRFVNGLRAQLTVPVILLIAIFAFGCSGYKLIAVFTNESWTWLECSFMTAITLSTVGYGDVLGLSGNTVATVYTMLLMLAGMGIVLYCISTVIAFLIEEGFGIIFKEHKMLKQISQMRNHYIVAGGGATGIHVAEELCHSGVEFVVIDTAAQTAEKLREEMPGVHILCDDATDDNALLNAGIKHAKGLVSCLGNDKDNLYLTISARILNPNIKIVARGVDDAVQKKLRRAGADAVVSPNRIGGLRLASEIVRPNAVSFLDRMLRAGHNKRVSEITIQSGSTLANVPLHQSGIQEKTGLLVVGVLEADADDYIYNPTAQYVLSPGSTVIVIGKLDAVATLRKMATA